MQLLGVPTPHDAAGVVVSRSPCAGPETTVKVNVWPFSSPPERPIAVAPSSSVNEAAFASAVGGSLASVTVTVNAFSNDCAGLPLSVTRTRIE